MLIIFAIGFEGPGKGAGAILPLSMGGQYSGKVVFSTLSLNQPSMLEQSPGI